MDTDKKQVSGLPLWDGQIAFSNKLIFIYPSLYLYHSKPRIVSSILQIVLLDAIPGSKFHQIFGEFTTLL